VRGRATADSLLSQARDNVELVAVGRGAHNVAYADDLLRASLELVRQAADSGRLAYRVPNVDLGPAVSENACLQCHLGQEPQVGSVAGLPFDHTRHVMQAETECTDCHTGLDNHGGTRVDSRASCDGCHHNVVEPMNCARCHEGLGGAPGDPIQTDIGRFPHSSHLDAGLRCRQCHTPPAMNAANLDCDNCHEQHHVPAGVQCANCHGDRVKAFHPPALFQNSHPDCSTCHGETGRAVTEMTRPVCLVCHVEKNDGHFPGDCTMCHQVRAQGEAEHPMTVGGG
jgi:hypothetical protein